MGGGVAGLASAALLARGGADVTLFEQHDDVGGRAGQWRQDGFTFDLGPSWLFMPEVFEHVFALLGRRWSDAVALRRLDPAYRVFPEAGEPLDVVADASANWAAFEALEPGAGARMRRYAEESAETYRIALDRFLYSTFERPARTADPVVLARGAELRRLLTSSLADHVSSTTTHPLLAQLLGYHAVFLGSAPGRVPALYSLMSHLDLGTSAGGVLYPEGGIYAVVEALAAAAREEGVDVRTGVTVRRIVVDGGTATGVLTHPSRGGGDTVHVPADVVVGAADLHHVETALLDAPWRTHPERRWARRNPGVSALLVYAGVRGELPELAHHSLFFTRDWDANFEAVLGPGRHRVWPPGPRRVGAERLSVPDPASLYVSRPTATDPALAPPGHEALVVLVPVPSDPALGAGADGRAHLEALADRYLDQIGAWAHIPDLRGRVVLRRVVGPADFASRYGAWRGGALGLEHTLAQSAMFRPAGVSARVPNLLYAGGSTTPGVGLPMCLISAELVVKRLLGETSAHPLPAPLRPGYLDAARPSGHRHWGAHDRGAAR
ncbi:phytoene desaturase [Beutenbergia cavernae DSM 12333]|uniref:Phytoene desaturase n=1 Tax=Beutenbergia cavernae (strain ATCC BAA-8 / DSM 12333 / CCUG 43141 / JCM 11478 / NBRC 16432 / NCIMB 13614 / HKI 0122) TaxID=471853 RepID=C5C2A8_BEUC1|nr:phytoene desaturase family protein [Beutenbergia cavernae]ACQ81733.1 phytoene desaturase [Beutenbergia cavernae DSM 12333]